MKGMHFMICIILPECKPAVFAMVQNTESRKGPGRPGRWIRKPPRKVFVCFEWIHLGYGHIPSQTVAEWRRDLWTPAISLDVFSTFGGQLRTESTNALVNFSEMHWWIWVHFSHFFKNTESRKLPGRPGRWIRKVTQKGKKNIFDEQGDEGLFFKPHII